MPIRILFTAAAIVGAVSCVSPGAGARDCDGTPCAAIGETLDTGTARITPLEVLEDSRCPIEARCVTAGEFKLRALVERDDRSREIILDWTDPVPALSGNTSIRRIWPDASVHTMPIDAGDYRFTFDWTPHIADPVAGPAIH